jgi:hypothetical protein
MNAAAGKQRWGTDKYRRGNKQVIESRWVQWIADARDEGRQVCVTMVAGVRNAGEPGNLEHQGEEQEQAWQGGVEPTVSEHSAI